VVNDVVHKELILDERDAELLERCARDLGVSESEVVRRGIEAIARGSVNGAARPDRRTREEALASFLALAEAQADRARRGEPPLPPWSPRPDPRLREIERQRGWTRDELHEREGDIRRGWTVRPPADAE
jgi:hypothetical protein